MEVDVMRVYVHGNCQAPAVANLLSQRFPAWDIASYEVFSEKIISEIDRYHHYVETADIIISQPIHDHYRERGDLSLSWLRSTSKRKAEFVIFPSMFFDGQLVGCRSMRIPAYGMPYHDVLLVHLVAHGLSYASVIEILEDDHLYSEKFIETEIELSISEMRRREDLDKIDVPLSPFLSDYGTSTQIFHVINHPCRPPLAYIANQILRYLGFGAGVSFVGSECLRFPHIPLMPAVSRFIDKRGYCPAGWKLEKSELYHLPNELLTPREYIERAIAHLDQYTNEYLISCLSDGHVQPFLERTARFFPSLPGVKRWIS